MLQDEFDSLSIENIIRSQKYTYLYFICDSVHSSFKIYFVILIHCSPCRSYTDLRTWGKDFSREENVCIIYSAPQLCLDNVRWFSFGRPTSWEFIVHQRVHDHTYTHSLILFSHHHSILRGSDALHFYRQHMHVVISDVVFMSTFLCDLLLHLLLAA